MKKPYQGMAWPYDDIINLPHHVSATRPHMPLEKRAAQFSPFHALVGYDVAVEEAARLTEERIELGESAITALDMKLALLNERIAGRPVAAVTYFRQDEKKEGGAYITVTDAVKKIDEYERTIVLMNGEKIPIEDIFDIESEVFRDVIF